MLPMAVACCVLFSEKCAENLERKGDISTATIRKARTLFMIICKMSLCCKKNLELQLGLWKDSYQILLALGNSLASFCDVYLVVEFPGTLPIGQRRMKNYLPGKKNYLSQTNWTTLFSSPCDVDNPATFSGNYPANGLIHHGIGCGTHVIVKIISMYTHVFFWHKN